MSAADLYAAARADAEAVARHFWGDPDKRQSSARVMRWGRKGSRTLRLAGAHAGRWWDHEADEGGDPADLIARETGADTAGVLRWIKEWTGGAVAPVDHAAIERERAERERVDEADRTGREEAARRIWRTSTPIAGTLAHDYLVRRLAADPVPPDVLAAGHLRFHADLRRPDDLGGGRGPALVALLTDPETGEGGGVHRTFLAPDGGRLAKRTLGRKAGLVVRIDDPDRAGDPMLGLHVAEGIETALAARVRYGAAPAWAAVDAGNLASLPPLRGCECITVFADADHPDERGRRAGQDAARALIARWREAGCEAHAYGPSMLGTDIADLHHANRRAA